MTELLLLYLLDRSLNNSRVFKCLIKKFWFYYLVVRLMERTAINFIKMIPILILVILETNIFYEEKPLRVTTPVFNQRVVFLLKK
jgi:hypothetical protein